MSRAAFGLALAVVALAWAWARYDADRGNHVMEGCW